MKNFIDYYYNINVSEIKHIHDKYFMYTNNERYMLKVFGDTDFFMVYEYLANQLDKYLYFFRIVKNRQNDYLTYIDDKPYILLKLSDINNNTISIYDIKINQFFEYSNKISRLIRFPWVKLWENKIDYFEEWCYLKQNQYKNMYSLFHYFIGIAENAVLYLKITEAEEKVEEIDRLVISHNRLSMDSSLYDYYDPTNIVLDHPSRDVSEYIKSTYVHGNFDIKLLEEYLNEHHFSKYGLRLLYARILFPSFFFDYIDEMILNSYDTDLLYLEARIIEFEKFISQISVFFKEKYDIPVVTWCSKEISY